MDFLYNPRLVMGGPVFHATEGKLQADFMLRILLSLIVLGVLGAGGYFGFREWSKGDRPIVYKSAPVTRGTLVSTVTATGNLEPLVKVLVGSQVSGTVTKWYADFNQRVE